MLRSDDVGTALRQLRGSRPLREVAREAGLSEAELSEYEEGRKMPESAALDSLREALEVSEAQLDRQVLRVWRRRLDASDPDREVRRREMLEHVQAIGSHLTALVSKLEDRYD